LNIRLFNYKEGRKEWPKRIEAVYFLKTMKAFRSAIFIFLTVISFPLRAGDGFCSIRNTSFQATETITFKVMYSLVGDLSAGEVTFSSTLEMLNNKPVYHLVGDGKTYPSTIRF
jgi:hypothetical protein